MKFVLIVIGAFLFALICTFVIFAFVYCFILGKMYQVVARYEAYKFKVWFTGQYSKLEDRVMTALSAPHITLQKQMEATDAISRMKEVFTDERFKKRIEIMELHLFINSKFIETDARKKSKSTS